MMRTKLDYKLKEEINS